jgi:hypothetical protein
VFDPDKVPESQIVNAQSLPFAITQNLFEFEKGPQTLVSKFEPLLRLSFSEDLPLRAIRQTRPSSHTIPLRRERSIPLDPFPFLKAKVKRCPAARAQPPPPRSPLPRPQRRDALASPRNLLLSSRGRLQHLFAQGVARRPVNDASAASA